MTWFLYKELHNHNSTTINIILPSDNKNENGEEEKIMNIYFDSAAISFNQKKLIRKKQVIQVILIIGRNLESLYLIVRFMGTTFQFVRKRQGSIFSKEFV